MAAKLSARIIGLGSYLPKKVLTNADLEKMVETSDEWIVSRTGMKERRLADATEPPSMMGAAAAKKALAAAKVSPDQVELVLVATMTPDYLSPSTAALIQANIKAKNAAAMDLQAACSGYLYALATAKAYIEAGLYRTILVIATEKMSSVVDYKDRSTCVLFGDGASAAVITAKGSGLSIGTVCLGADGSLAELLYIPGGGSRHPACSETIEARQHYLKMNGKELFKHAVRRMGSATLECLKKEGLHDTDVEWLIPHQANIRIIEAIAKNLNLSHDKVYKTLHKYGNTSASSVAIALDELMQEHPLKRGQHILLVAFGAGLTWGAVLLTKVSK